MHAEWPSAVRAEVGRTQESPELTQYLEKVMGLRRLAFHTRLYCEEIGVEKPEHSSPHEVPVPRK